MGTPALAGDRPTTAMHGYLGQVSRAIMDGHTQNHHHVIHCPARLAAGLAAARPRKLLSGPGHSGYSVRVDFCAEWIVWTHFRRCLRPWWSHDPQLRYQLKLATRAGWPAHIFCDLSRIAATVNSLAILEPK